jgi:alpha-ketoglutarate-dependent taurine dioxygenase
MLSTSLLQVASMSRPWVLLQRLQLDEPAIRLAVAATGMSLITSHDGYVSTVRETGKERDFSRQTGFFDYHTDGLYLAQPPEAVLLHCVSTGASANPTVLADTVDAISRLPNADLRVLRQLDLVYIASTGERHSRPLIEDSSGRMTASLASRGYVAQSPRVSSPPTMREIAAAMSALFVALESAVILEHEWAVGDVLVFDNHRLVHARRGLPGDVERVLLRAWIANA